MDTAIFSRVLYQLSYLGVDGILTEGDGLVKPKPGQRTNRGIPPGYLEYDIKAPNITGIICI